MRQTRTTQHAKRSKNKQESDNNRFAQKIRNNFKSIDLFFIDFSLFFYLF